MHITLRALTVLLAALHALAFAPLLRAEPLPNVNGLPPGEIFILGTRHLFDIKETYDRSILTPLLDRLEEFRPDLIAIEALRGEDIATMELRPEWNSEALNPYAYPQRAMGGIAQAELAVDWRVANAAVVAGFDTNESNDSRANAVLHYLAAYEYHSALLTWYGGSAEFKDAFEQKYGKLAEDFDKRMESTNEYYSVALPLAGKLGHDRLYAVDDHFEGGAMEAKVATLPGGWDSLMELFGDVQNHPFVSESNSRFEAAARAGDVLPYYRWLNLPETGARDEAFQWHPLMTRDNDSRIGAVRLAGWEMRNLRIASHLAELMIANPGKRILFIVGSGHKPILDRLLRTMNWIRVVPSGDVLGTEPQPAGGV